VNRLVLFILFLFARQVGRNLQEVQQVGDQLFGLRHKRRQKPCQFVAVVGFIDVDIVVFNIRPQLLAADASFVRVGQVVIAEDLIQQFFKGLIADAEAAAVFIAEQDFGLDKHAFAPLVAAELKIRMIGMIGPQETGEIERIERCGQEVRQFLSQAGEFIGLDGGAVIEAVYPTGVVADDGDLFVADGPLGLHADFSAIKPHGLGDHPAVVADDAVLDVDKVL